MTDEELVIVYKYAASCFCKIEWETLEKCKCSWKQLVPLAGSGTTTSNLPSYNAVNQSASSSSSVVDGGDEPALNSATVRGCPTATEDEQDGGVADFHKMALLLYALQTGRNGEENLISDRVGILNLLCEKEFGCSLLNPMSALIRIMEETDHSGKGLISDSGAHLVSETLTHCWDDLAVAVAGKQEFALCHAFRSTLLLCYSLMQQNSHVLFRLNEYFTCLKLSHSMETFLSDPSTQVYINTILALNRQQYGTVTRLIQTMIYQRFPDIRPIVIDVFFDLAGCVTHGELTRLFRPMMLFAFLLLLPPMALELLKAQPDWKLICQWLIGDKSGKSDILGCLWRLSSITSKQQSDPDALPTIAELFQIGSTTKDSESSQVNNVDRFDETKARQLVSLIQRIRLQLSKPLQGKDTVNDVFATASVRSALRSLGVIQDSTSISLGTTTSTGSSLGNVGDSEALKPIKALLQFTRYGKRVKARSEGELICLQRSLVSGLPSMFGHNLVSHAGHLYLFGGQFVEDYFDAENRRAIPKGLSNRLYQFNPATKQWKLLAPTGDGLPPPVKHAAVAVLGNFMYVWGGVRDIIGAEPPSAVSKSVEVSTPQGSPQGQDAASVSVAVPAMASGASKAPNTGITATESPVTASHHDHVEMWCWSFESLEWKKVVQKPMPRKSNSKSEEEPQGKTNRFGIKNLLGMKRTQIHPAPISGKPGAVTQEAKSSSSAASSDDILSLYPPLMWSPLLLPVSLDSDHGAKGSIWLYSGAESRRSTTDPTAKHQSSERDKNDTTKYSACSYLCCELCNLDHHVGYHSADQTNYGCGLGAAHLASSFVTPPDGSVWEFHFTDSFEGEWSQYTATNKKDDEKIKKETKASTQTKSSEVKAAEQTQTDDDQYWPQPRRLAGGVLVENKYIVVWGGTRAAGSGSPGDIVYPKEVDVFNVTNRKWYQAVNNDEDDAPLGRQGHTMGLHQHSPTDSRIYIYGGVVTDPKGGMPVPCHDIGCLNISPLNAPDPSTELSMEWSPVASALSADDVRIFSSVQFGFLHNALCLFGGLSNVGSQQPNIDRFTNQLVLLQPGPGTAGNGTKLEDGDTIMPPPPNPNVGKTVVLRWASNNKDGFLGYDNQGSVQWNTENSTGSGQFDEWRCVDAGNGMVYLCALQYQQGCYLNTTDNRLSLTPIPGDDARLVMEVARTVADSGGYSLKIPSRQCTIRVRNRTVLIDNLGYPSAEVEGPWLLDGINPPSTYINQSVMFQSINSSDPTISSLEPSSPTYFLGSGNSGNRTQDTVSEPVFHQIMGIPVPKRSEGDGWIVRHASRGSVYLFNTSATPVYYSSSQSPPLVLSILTRVGHTNVKTDGAQLSAELSGKSTTKLASGGPYSLALRPLGDPECQQRFFMVIANNTCRLQSTTESDRVPLTLGCTRSGEVYGEVSDGFHFETADEKEPHGSTLLWRILRYAPPYHMLRFSIEWANDSKETTEKRNNVTLLHGTRKIEPAICEVKVMSNGSGRAGGDVQGDGERQVLEISLSPAIYVTHFQLEGTASSCEVFGCCPPVATPTVDQPDSNPSNISASPSLTSISSSIFRSLYNAPSSWELIRAVQSVVSSKESVLLINDALDLDLDQHSSAEDFKQGDDAFRKPKENDGSASSEQTTSLDCIGSCQYIYCTSPDQGNGRRLYLVSDNNGIVKLTSKPPKAHSHLQTGSIHSTKSEISFLKPEASIGSRNLKRSPSSLSSKKPRVTKQNSSNRFGGSDSNSSDASLNDSDDGYQWYIGKPSASVAMAAVNMLSNQLLHERNEGTSGIVHLTNMRTQLHLGCTSEDVAAVTINDVDVNLTNDDDSDGDGFDGLHATGMTSMFHLTDNLSIHQAIVLVLDSGANASSSSSTLSVGPAAAPVAYQLVFPGDKGQGGTLAVVDRTGSAPNFLSTLASPANNLDRLGSGSLKEKEEESRYDLTLQQRSETSALKRVDDSASVTGTNTSTNRQRLGDGAETKGLVVTWYMETVEDAVVQIQQSGTNVEAPPGNAVNWESMINDCLVLLQCLGAKGKEIVELTRDFIAQVKKEIHEANLVRMGAAAASARSSNSNSRNQSSSDDPHHPKEEDLHTTPQRALQLLSGLLTSLQQQSAAGNLGDNGWLLGSECSAALLALASGEAVPSWALMEFSRKLGLSPLITHVLTTSIRAPSTPAELLYDGFVLARSVMLHWSRQERQQTVVPKPITTLVARLDSLLTIANLVESTRGGVKESRDVWPAMLEKLIEWLVSSPKMDVVVLRVAMLLSAASGSSMFFSLIQRPTTKEVLMEELGRFLRVPVNFLKALVGALGDAVRGSMLPLLQFIEKLAPDMFDLENNLYWKTFLQSFPRQMNLVSVTSPTFRYPGLYPVSYILDRSHLEWSRPNVTGNPNNNTNSNGHNNALSSIVHTSHNVSDDAVSLSGSTFSKSTIDMMSKRRSTTVEQESDLIIELDFKQYSVCPSAYTLRYDDTDEHGPYPPTEWYLEGFDEKKAKQMATYSGGDEAHHSEQGRHGSSRKRKKHLSPWDVLKHHTPDRSDTQWRTDSQAVDSSPRATSRRRSSATPMPSSRLRTPAAAPREPETSCSCSWELLPVSRPTKGSAEEKLEESTDGNDIPMVKEKYYRRFRLRAPRLQPVVNSESSLTRYKTITSFNAIGFEIYGKLKHTAASASVSRHVYLYRYVSDGKKQLNVLGCDAKGNLKIRTLQPATDDPNHRGQGYGPKSDRESVHNSSAGIAAYMSSHGNLEEQWSVEDAGDGLVYLVSVEHQLRLSFTAASTKATARDRYSRSEKLSFLPVVASRGRGVPALPLGKYNTECTTVKVTSPVENCSLLFNESGSEQQDDLIIWRPVGFGEMTTWNMTDVSSNQRLWLSNTVVWIHSGNQYISCSDNSGRVGVNEVSSPGINEAWVIEDAGSGGTTVRLRSKLHQCYLSSLFETPRTDKIGGRHSEIKLQATDNNESTQMFSLEFVSAGLTLQIKGNQLLCIEATDSSDATGETVFQITEAHLSDDLPTSGAALQDHHAAIAVSGDEEHSANSSTGITRGAAEHELLGEMEFKYTNRNFDDKGIIFYLGQMNAGQRYDAEPDPATGGIKQRRTPEAWRNPAFTGQQLVLDMLKHLNIDVDLFHELFRSMVALLSGDIKTALKHVQELIRRRYGNDKDKKIEIFTAIFEMLNGVLERNIGSVTNGLPKLIELFQLPQKVKVLLELTTALLTVGSSSSSSGGSDSGSGLNSAVSSRGFDSDGSANGSSSGTLVNYTGTKKARFSSDLEAKLRSFGNEFKIDPALITGMIGLAKRDMRAVGALALRFGACEPQQIQKLITIIEHVQSLSPTSLFARLTGLGASDSNDNNDTNTPDSKSNKKVGTAVSSSTGLSNISGLFDSFDETGMGSIDYYQFQDALKYMNIDVSGHHVMKLFTESATPDGKLHKMAFETAICKLQTDIASKALGYMGLSMGRIAKIFILLTFLLLLLFMFIFLGMNAFRVGSTFGTVVNSILPIAAAVGVGQGGAGNAKELQQKAQGVVHLVLDLIKRTM